MKLLRLLAFSASLLAAASCGGTGEDDDLSQDENLRADPQCEAPNGVRFHGRSRYVHGANYAWRKFGADFGGIGAWGMKSVSQDPAPFDRDLAALSKAGASVIRWWIFPDMRTDGVTKDASGQPLGVSATALADIDKALELAQKNDIYVMFVFTSFDAFKQSFQNGDVRGPSIAPIVRSGSKLTSFLSNVYAPVVERASKSRYAHRVFAWDLMNEPEWAVSDLGQPKMCGAATGKTDCVTYKQMHWFLAQLSAKTRALTSSLPPEKRPLITIGSVRPSTHRNWEAVPQDFYQFHFYQGDYEDGYLSLPRLDKSSIIGEFPSWGLKATGGRPALNASGIGEEIRKQGFHGGLGWTYTADDQADWPALAKGIRAFADAQGCKAKY